jgi:RND family efflux transporter MFP subunit
MRVPRRFLSVSLTILAIVGVGGGTWYTKMKRDKAKADSTQPRPTTPGGAASATSATDQFATGVAIAVEGAKVVKDTLVLYIDASGQAEPLRQIPITAEASGRIVSLAYRESDVVTAGSLVMALDTIDFAFALQQAKIALQQAQAQYQEATLTDDLIPDKAVRAARDTAARIRSGLEAAKIRLQQAQMDYARAQTRAPFNGRAADVKVALGQKVGAGTEIMKLIEMDPIRVTAQVLEGDVGLLARGRKARVTFAAYPGQTFIGTVETINPMVDQGTRTARVSILVPNSKGQILPGMYARAKIEARKFADRIIVPRAAVLTRSNGEMLFVYNPDGAEGIAEWRYVTTGLGNDELVEIIENADTKMVKPGEIVLTGGHYTLAHGTRVKVVEKATANGGRPN